MHVGAVVAYDLTVTNHGPDTAQAVRLEARLGTVDVTRLVPETGACTLDEGVATCTLGSLAAGTATSVHIGVRSHDPRFLFLTATVSTSTFDPSLFDASAAPNYALAQTPVIP